MNKHMQQFVLRLLLCAVCLPAMAQHVSEQVALERAQSFLQAPASSASPKGMRKAPRKAPRLKAAVTREEFYIFNDEANQGFVIVSGEERTPDILGYSDEGCFDSSNIPDNVKAWLDGYAEQIQAIAASPSKAEEEVDFSREPIAPLMKTKWGQGDPYNLLTPFYGAKHCPVGCAATAMAQIMNYWKYPQQTIAEIPVPTSVSSNISLTYTGGAIPKGTKIDWDNMLADYGTVSITEVQKQAVAQLMLECGLAVNMQYGINESGAYDSDINPALANYFGYADESRLLRRVQFDYTDWLYILYNELLQERPIFYSGNGTKGGHGFVCDGYDEEDFFHINWGWNGNYNGCFRVELMNPYPDMSYPDDQSALVGVLPKGQASDASLLAVREIIINKESYTRSTTSANFTGVSITPRLFMTTIDKYVEHAIALEKDGQVISILSSSSSNLQIGDIRETSVSLQFGANLDDGVYQLVPVCRKKGETTWQHDIDADQTFVDATINSKNLTLALHQTSFQGVKLTCVGTPVVTGNYRSNCENIVTYKIRNDGTEDFSGKLTLKAIPTQKYQQGSNSASTSIVVQQVDIKARQTSNISIPFTPNLPPVINTISEILNGLTNKDSGYRFSLNKIDGEIKGTDFVMLASPVLGFTFCIDRYLNNFLFLPPKWGYDNFHDIINIYDEHVDDTLVLKYLPDPNYGTQYYAPTIKDDVVVMLVKETREESGEVSRTIIEQKEITIDLQPGNEMRIPIRFDFHEDVNYAYLCFTHENSYFEYSCPGEKIAKIRIIGGPQQPDVVYVTPTCDTEEGGYIEGCKARYLKGEEVTLTAYPCFGYEFAYWTQDDGTILTTENQLKFNATRNHYPVAHFKEKGYAYHDITATASPSGSCIFLGVGPHKEGESVGIIASSTDPNLWEFENWTEDGTVISTANGFNLEDLSKDHHLVAHYKKIKRSTLTVATDPSKGGTATAVVHINWNWTDPLHKTDTIIANPTNGGKARGTFPDESLTEFIATPAEGYKFVNWTRDDLDWFYNANNLTFWENLFGSSRYVAHFRKIEFYSITATSSPTNGGTVSGTGTYEEGKSVTLTATPAEGYTFDNWTENGTVVSTNAIYTFDATQNRNLVANFMENTCNVIVECNPENGGTATGEGVYEGGTTIYLHAKANAGYEFLGWTELLGTGDETVYDYTSSIRVRVVRSMHLIANFRKLPTTYTITVRADPAEGGTVTGAGIFSERQIVPLTATPAKGYTFVNWTENGTVVSNDATYIVYVTQNHNLVANFKKDNTYAVTYQIKYNNKVVATAKTHVFAGSPLPEPPASLTNDFITLTKSGTYPETVTTDITVTLVATWNGPFQFTSSLSDATWYVMSIRNGYYISKQVSEPYKPAKVDDATRMNPEYHWAFGGDPYHIKVYNKTTGLGETLAIDGENVVMRPGGYSWDILPNGNGFNLRVQGTTNECVFHYIGSRGLTFWDDESTLTHSGARLMTTLAPDSETTTYAITATANPAIGGTVSGAGTYKEGASVTLTATPAEGYTFVNWTENGTVVSTNDVYSFSATQERNLVANFELLTTNPVVTYKVRLNNKVIATAQVEVTAGAALPELPASLSNDFLMLTKSGTHPATVTKNVTVYYDATWNGPFQFTSSLSDATWYVMSIRNGYYIAKQESEPYKPAKVDDVTLINPEYHWAFGGDPYHVKVYNKTTGLGETLAVDGSNIVMRSGDFSWDILSNGKGFNLRIPETTNSCVFHYVGSRGLTFWADDATFTHSASRLNLTLVSDVEDGIHNVMSDATPVAIYTTSGTMVGTNIEALDELPAGIYIFRLRDGSTKKVVIK